jgi:hypothetical protein
MNLRAKLVTLSLFCGALFATPQSVNASDGFEFPKVLSFTANPIDVEIASVNPTVNFSLEVSHTIGIASTSTNVVFSSTSSNSQISVKINRSENPVDLSLKKVVFKGSAILPNSFAPGIYSFYAEPITAIASQGASAPKTGNIYPVNFRNFVDAENAILIRSNGELNLDFQTFVGPTYPSTLNVSDSKPRNRFTSEPIWKVGETFKIDDYFEMRTPLAILQATSSTPKVCSSDGKILKFIDVGSCSFTVFTPKNANYLYKKLDLNATITEARKAQTILITQIPNQTSKDLPKVVSISSAYDSNGNLVLPTTTTPEVCAPTLNSVKIVSGGTCTLKYFKDADRNYLASEVYTQSFEVTRDPQSITFTLPSTANVSTRSIALAATASSGGAITYSTASAGICSITGSTLNLLRNGNCAVTATQAGTSTLAPASATATVVLSGAAVSNRKTITCVKGKSTKRVSGVNPKCPKGFKIKR